MLPFSAAFIWLIICLFSFFLLVSQRNYFSNYCWHAWILKLLKILQNWDFFFLQMFLHRLWASKLSQPTTRTSCVRGKRRGPTAVLPSQATKWSISPLAGLPGPPWMPRYLRPKRWSRIWSRTSAMAFEFALWTLSGRATLQRSEKQPRCSQRRVSKRHEFLRRRPIKLLMKLQAIQLI